MNNCKFYKQKKQYSTDSGVTWVDVYPLETRKGDFYQSDSNDCSVSTIYRWITVENDYDCVGTTKVTKEKYQYSNDNGTTWTDVSPAEYRAGSTVLEVNSYNCGYQPPLPSDIKLRVTYNDSSTYDVECNNNTTLTEYEVSGGSKPISAIKSAIIGECVSLISGQTFYNAYSMSSVTISDGVTTIDSDAFAWCSGLTEINFGSGLTTIKLLAFQNCWALHSINLPDSLLIIEFAAFEYCSGATSLTIPRSVVSIENMAFQGCNHLESITVLATTPPTTSIYGSFEDTNNCPIYVPASSVNAYKSASGWSRYADRIQAIS